jgi:hypothetical protein
VLNIVHKKEEKKSPFCEALLIVLRVRLSNEKIRQSAKFPALKSSGERTADL